MNLDVNVKAKLRRARAWATTNPRRARAVAFIVLLALALVAYGLPFATGDGVRHLSAYGEGGQDAGAIRVALEDANVQVRSAATSPHLLGALEHPEESALVVLGVERPYTDGEVRTILDFVAAGGSLVLADDTGNGLRLTRHFNYSVDGYPVLDEGSNYNNDPHFVTTTATLDGRTYDLIFNAPSQLYTLDGEPAEVLARSSTQSYLDYDHDGEIESGTPTGPFDLIVRTTHGEGTVILVSDPALFMNHLTAMSEFENEDFARALLQPLVGERGVIVFDESRHLQPPTVASTNEAMRALVLASSTPVWNWIIALLLAGGAVVAVYLTKETEDWREHEHRLDEVLHAPDTVRPDADRVKALALRAVSERYNMSPDAVQALSQQELARMTGDPGIAALVTGETRGSEATKLLLRLIEHDSSAPEASSPEATP